MPMNSAVREILPPKRLICATRYSRSNTSRASRSGRLISRSPPAPFGVDGTSAPTSEGSMSAVISASGSPAVRIIRRSTLLRSCLMFPRHVGDFVNVERAAMRLFQCADFAALPIHGLGAEKFDFHRLGRDRRCVDDVERTAGAV